MKKLISLLIVCFVYSSLHAQALRVRVDSLSVSIGRSDAKIENLNIDTEILNLLEFINERLNMHEKILNSYEASKNFANITRRF